MASRIVLPQGVKVYNRSISQKEFPKVKKDVGAVQDKNACTQAIALKALKISIGQYGSLSMRHNLNKRDGKTTRSRGKKRAKRDAKRKPSSRKSKRAVKFLVPHETLEQGEEDKGKQMRAFESSRTQKLKELTDLARRALEEIQRIRDQEREEEAGFLSKAKQFLGGA